ncbi:hypothetical protein D3C71_1452450 [compost metagenome]
MPKPIMLLPTPSSPPTCKGTARSRAASCSGGSFFLLLLVLRAATFVGAAGTGGVAFAMCARKLL